VPVKIYCTYSLINYDYTQFTEETMKLLIYSEE
jgi:hypothetical protein